MGRWRRCGRTVGGCCGLAREAARGPGLDAGAVLMREGFVGTWRAGAQERVAMERTIASLAEEESPFKPAPVPS